MKELIVLFTLMSFAFTSFANDERKYSVNEIPLDLLKDADAVKRSEEAILVIDGTNSARYILRYAITILNAKADYYNTSVIGYSKLVSFKSLKGTLYDSQGNQIMKLKPSDILDIKSTDGFSLYDDSRIKIAKLNYHTYPYTVEFEEEVVFNGLLSLPNWQPVSSYNLAVQQSSYKVVCTDNADIRYKEMRLQSPLKLTKNGREIIYEWNAINLNSLKYEPLSSYLKERTPLVLIAPKQFELEGYKGDMTTWQSFGKWEYQLNSGRDRLPDFMKQKVKELIAGISDKREQVKVLYEHLQKNTRYVSVQLGIGGWQTFDANYVATRGYGDCKALTNYMYSILKEVGIPSNPSLVYGDDDGAVMHPDFPSANQFNHMILNVPMEKDTIWLECTSQTSAFGYLGQFTADRWVLSLTSEGGELIRTPAFKQQDNFERRTAKVSFDLQGNAHASLKATYAGAFQDRLGELVSAESKGKMEKRLYQRINLQGLKINTFSYVVEKDKIPRVTEQVDFDFTNYVSISGKRIFLQPNLLNRSGWVPDKTESRTSDILLKFPYTDEDEIVYTIPENYTIESKPEDISVRSPFGEFSTSVRIEKNKLIYIRKIKLNSGRFDASKFNELAGFYTLIAKADKSKVVLVSGI